MATKPKSYRKGDYIYTESSPGSNKYQNFTAAKPTVKKVRDDSRQDKAGVAAKKVTSPKYRGGPEGDGKAVATKASTSPKYRGGPEGDGKMIGRQPSGSAPFSKGKGSPSVPPRGQEQRFRPAPEKVSMMGSIINRVTQPPRKLAPASVKMLNESAAEITPVVTSLAGGRLLYKGGKKLVEAGAKFFRKKPSVSQSNRQPRPIEELGVSTVAKKTRPAPSRPFPQPKKGAKKFPGYTSQLEKPSRATAAKKAAKTRKNVKQFLNETGLKPRRGSTWQY